jgi:hypothetical protein
MTIGTTQKVRLEIRKGLATDINTAATLVGNSTNGYSAALAGEPFYTTDGKKLYVFDGTINRRVHGLDMIMTSDGEVMVSDGEILWLGELT